MAYATVFLTGMLGIWKAIPVGIAFGLTMVETAVLTSSGSISSAFILFVYGKKIKSFLLKKYSKDKLKKQKKKALKLTERFGLTGLALIGTGAFGPIGALVLALLFFHPDKKFIFFAFIGIIFWSFVLSFAAYSGFHYYQSFTVLILNRLF